MTTYWRKGDLQRTQRSDDLLYQLDSATYCHLVYPINVLESQADIFDTDRVYPFTLETFKEARINVRQ